MRLDDARIALTLFLLAASSCATESDVVDARLDLGKVVYASCGACHLPSGEGVVGAFPPLQNRVADIASMQLGREYLITVVLDGLSGSIDVNGTPYFGHMQAHRQTLDDEQISAVLNYVMYELADKPPEGVVPFVASEVNALREKSKTESVSGLELRQSLDIQ